MNNKLMKKITVLLTTIGLIVIPLTGCNSNVKVFGKDVVTIEEPDDREFNKTVPNDNQEATYTEEDAVDALIQGEYNVNYKGEDFSFDVAELLNLVFPNSNIYTKKITDTVFQVKIDNGTDYVVFEVNFIDESINEVEMFYGGEVYTGEDAHQMMLQILASIIEEGSGSNSTTIDSL